MNRRNAAIGTLAVLVLATVVTDVWFFKDDIESNTFSSILRNSVWAPGVIGYAAAHTANKTKPGKGPPAAASVIAGVIALGSSIIVGGGIPGLLIGGILGWMFWGNDGTT